MAETNETVPADVYVDITLDVADLSKIAYYRIDPHFRDFLLKCREQHRIAGFKWDGESLNFGVILVEKDGLA